METTVYTATINKTEEQYTLVFTDHENDHTQTIELPETANTEIAQMPGYVNMLATMI